MRRPIPLLFWLLVALSVVACEGGGPNPLLPGGPAMQLPNLPPGVVAARDHELAMKRHLLKVLVVGFSKHHRRKPVVTIIYVTALPKFTLKRDPTKLPGAKGTRHLLFPGAKQTPTPTPPPTPTPIPTQTPTPFPSTSPEPTPWCPYDPNQQVCSFLTPPGGFQALAAYCSDCTALDNPVTTTLTFNPTYTPPPSFLIQTAGCQNNTCAPPTTCTYGSACAASTCWENYSTCFTLTQWTAQEGTPPANVVTSLQLTTPLQSFALTDFYITVTPDVVDLDIPGANQVVSANNANPSPSPIMVGEEVRLQASPAAALSSVQWTYDYWWSAGEYDVVGSYGLLGPTPDPPNGPTTLAAPSPLATSNNPMMLYWLENGFLWPYARHLYLTAYAPNVQGPMAVDVYYPVRQPGAEGDSFSFANVAVSEASDCPPLQLFEALHLGVFCAWTSKPTPDPKPTPGINVVRTIQVNEPFGAGLAAEVQLFYEDIEGTVNGVPVQGWKSDPNGNYQLDTQFPAQGEQVVPPSGDANKYFVDSPYLNLGLSYCTYLSDSVSYQTYLMYQPNPRVTGHPSIWVPTAGSSYWAWNYSGAAANPRISPAPTNNGWALGTPPPVNPGPEPSLGPNDTMPTWSSVPQYTQDICKP